MPVVRCVSIDGSGRMSAWCAEEQAWIPVPRRETLDSGATVEPGTSNIQVAGNKARNAQKTGQNRPTGRCENQEKLHAKDVAHAPKRAGRVLTRPISRR